MSKLFTTESLSFLRDEFKNYDDLDLFLAKYQNEDFDFSNVELIDDNNYSSIAKASVNEFYNAFRDNPKDEFSLARILYESLKLDSSQASNNLYWLYLNFSSFFSYIKERWVQKLNEDAELMTDEIEKFFLSLEPSQNSLLKSPIAGLWWAIHLTVDDSLEDKYYYSKIFMSERNLRDKNMGSYQLIRDKEVFEAVLDFYRMHKDAEFEGKRIGSEAIAQQTMKALNQIGGLTVLSYLTKAEVFEKMQQFKSTIFQRAREVQLDKKKSRIKMELQRNNEPEMTSKTEKSYNEDKEKPKVLNEVHSAKVTGKILKHFNLNKSGEYNLTDISTSTFDFSIPISDNFINGDLLMCYNESGYINRVQVSEILKKKRELYQNGIYQNNTIQSISTSKREALIGIIYYKEGAKYFKCHYTNQLKDNNGNVGLQGYKMMYEAYDKIEYITLPIELSISLDRLIFKSLGASGKLFSNPNYKKEFEIINSYLNKIDLRLF
jgi:hypothetical protein